MLNPADRAEFDRSVALLEESLDPEVLRSAWAEGRAAALELDVAEVLGESRV